MITFWLPEAEYEAAKDAIAYLDATRVAGAPRVTLTTVCREALGRAAKRVNRQRGSAE